MSSGTLVLGLINGMLTGLLAVGIVLVYKSNRFLNLAHAQLGALSAQLLAKFVIDWGWQAQSIAFHQATHNPTITGPLIRAAQAQASLVIRNNFIQPTVNALGYTLTGFTLRWSRRQAA